MLQVKNPNVDIENDRSVPTLPVGKRAKYSKEIMDKVFGRGSKGTESAGLRFAGCERADLLDQEGAQVLLIASKVGEKGLEESLAEGRGEGKPSHKQSHSSDAQPRSSLERSRARGEQRVARGYIRGAKARSGQVSARCLGRGLDLNHKSSSKPLEKNKEIGVPCQIQMMSYQGISMRYGGTVMVDAVTSSSVMKPALLRCRH